MAIYNPFTDFNPFFTKYRNVEPEVTTTEDPLYGISNLPEGYRLSGTGNYIAPANTPEAQAFDVSFLDKMAGTHSEGETYSQIPSEDIPEIPSGSSSKSYTTKADLKGNRKKAMEFFQSKGLKAHQAAGLVGNLIRESQLDPRALNGSSRAMGIAQWLGDRKKRLIAKYGKHPTFEQQLDFVWEELNSTHKKGLEMLKQSLTVDEASANAFGWFEFSVGPKGAIQKMRKHGQDGLKSYNQGLRFSKELLS